MPDLDATTFTCGKVKADKKSVGAMEITVPNSFYLSSYRDDFACAVEKVMETVRPNRVNLGNQPVIVKVWDQQGHLLGQHQLFQDQDYRLNLPLNEALVRIPANQQVNFDVLSYRSQPFFALFIMVFLTRPEKT